MTKSFSKKIWIKPNARSIFINAPEGAIKQLIYRILNLKQTSLMISITFTSL